MIDENENIIVRNGNNVHMLGSGFSSKEDIEEEIKKRFDNRFSHGNYTYGTIEEIDSVKIEKKYPKTKSYTDLDEDKFEFIEKNVETDDRISNYYEHRNIGKYPNSASIYKQNIRYNEGEVDFSLKIRNDLFDNVPVSTLDENIENKIRNIFRDIVGENAVYMGYESSYAKRGRRDPYVSVYGRLKRDSKKDEEIRKLYNFDFIRGIYWSTDNVTPIPIYTQNNEIDVIAITKYTDSNDSYEKISEDILDNVKENISYLEDNYELIVNQIGKVRYKKESMAVYLGVKFVEYEV